MNNLALKTIRCAIRTLGFLVLVGLIIWSKKLLGWEWTYEDTKVLLGIITNFGPELVLLVMFGTNGLIFYRATKSDNGFDFVHFFIEGKPENIYRLGYFLLLEAALWSIFALYWCDKLESGYWAVIGGIFIGKAAIDSVGYAIVEREKAKQVEPPPVQQEIKP